MALDARPWLLHGNCRRELAIGSPRSGALDAPNPRISNPFNPAVAPYLAGSGQSMSSPGTMKMVALGVARQAQMQAFIDLFWFIGWVTFALLPLVFLMKRPERKGLALA